jgi:hypothetical protein
VSLQAPMAMLGGQPDAPQKVRHATVLASQRFTDLCRCDPPGDTRYGALELWSAQRTALLPRAGLTPTVKSDRRFGSLVQMVTKMSRWVRSGTALSVIVVLVAALEAIVTIHPSGVSRAQGGWSTTDPLNTSTTLPHGGFGAHYEVGTYDSDNLRIYGLICYPEGNPAFTPPYPVLIMNHGLWPAFPFPAITNNSLIGCIQMARAGWLVATSTYRGETIESTPGETPAFGPNFTPRTSDGQLELCGGEVHDVLNLLSTVKALKVDNTNRPLANPDQALMWGHSHGACITERAIESLPDPTTGPFPPKLIAVSIDGPTDFTTWHYSPWVGGLWDPFGVERNERSSSYPVNNPSKLANVSLVQFLRIQAENDLNVTPDQGCELAATFPQQPLPLHEPPNGNGIVNFYFHSGTQGNGSSSPTDKDCGAPLVWQTGQLLPNFAADKYGSPFGWTAPTFLMYDDKYNSEPDCLDVHACIPKWSWSEWASFVNAFIGGGVFEKPWNASIPQQYVPFE